MDLTSEIIKYEPINEQEIRDKACMLQYVLQNKDCLDRENMFAHFTASMWTLNQEHTKTLMVYHNIYDSWSWIGGHADGMQDLCAVALKELQEETGIRNARLLSTDIFSLETLTVNGHFKNGIYVPSHLHFNVTYVAEADEQESLYVNKNENQAVKWWWLEEVEQVSKEPWMIQNVYQKLLRKSSLI